MAELKLNLKDNTGLSEKNLKTKSNLEYFLFLSEKKITEDEIEEIEKIGREGDKTILATNNEENWNLKIFNCSIIPLDLKNNEKVEMFIKIINPKKIIKK